MLIVSIIGLLAVLTLPAFVKQRLRSQDAAFANNVRVVTAALEQHAIEKGDYPPDASPAEMPAGFAQYMPRRIAWTEDTPIGGQWDWDRAAHRTAKIHGIYAGLSVIAPKRTTVQMSAIDAFLDDGNIDTGSFRRRGNAYTYVLEE